MLCMILFLILHFILVLGQKQIHSLKGAISSMHIEIFCNLQQMTPTTVVTCVAEQAQGTEVSTSASSKNRVKVQSLACGACRPGLHCASRPQRDSYLRLLPFQRVRELVCQPPRRARRRLRLHGRRAEIDCHQPAPHLALRPARAPWRRSEASRPSAPSSSAQGTRYAASPRSRSASWVASVSGLSENRSRSRHGLIAAQWGGPSRSDHNLFSSPYDHHIMSLSDHESRKAKPSLFLFCRSSPNLVGPPTSRYRTPSTASRSIDWSESIPRSCH